MWRAWRVWHKNICQMWHVSHAILISCSNGLTFLVLRLKSLSPCLKSGIQPLLGWTIWAVIPIFYHRICVQVASHTSRYTLWLEFHLYFGPLHELIDFFSGKTIIWLELTKTSLTKVFWNILKSVAITYLENVTCVTWNWLSSCHFKGLSGMIMGVGDSFRLNGTQRDCSNTLKPKKELLNLVF